MDAKKKKGRKRKPNAEEFCRLAVVRTTDGMTCYYEWWTASEEHDLLALAARYNGELADPFMACVHYKHPFPGEAGVDDRPRPPGPRMVFKFSDGSTMDISALDAYKAQARQLRAVLEIKDRVRSEQARETARKSKGKRGLVDLKKLALDEYKKKGGPVQTFAKEFASRNDGCEWTTVKDWLSRPRRS
jgi:hypothetical protein